MDRSDNACEETQPRPLPAFEDRAPPDRYCDLILSGGITSAIAYSPATFALASVYRLRSVGGTSSGAGSAALAAAAEYRRRNGSADGFRLLLERTAEVANDHKGKTGLAWLFQPGGKKRRLFKHLTPGIASPDRKLGKIVGALWVGYWAWPLLFALVFIACLGLWAARTSSPGWAYVWGGVAGVVGLLTAFFAGLAWLWIDVRHVLDEGYGLCGGKDGSTDAPIPPLTVWLHELLQEVAGLPKDGSPLTFADLESAPGSPRAVLGTCGKDDELSIRLQMFTANLTLGRPRIFPLVNDPADFLPHKRPPDADEGVLYFRASDMRRLFPASVVEHLVKVSSEYTGSAQIEDPVRRYAAPNLAEETFRRLPGKRLPVVVAARMSVSFPVLFEAVPLWMVDTPGQGGSRMRRCIFSDGGFCSGFPIHLFDSAVPDWPTFAIALRDLSLKDGSSVCEQLDEMKKSIHIPQSQSEPIHDVWHGFDELPNGLARLGGLLGAMLSTLKDWNDTLQSDLPGVRDRIVRLGLAPGIGGLNILMSPEQIRALGVVGGEAAKALLKRFALPDRPDGLAQGWAEHRWVRFNVLRDCLTEALTGLSASAASGRFRQALQEQIDAARDEAPFVGAKTLLPAEAASLLGVLDALEEAERKLGAADAARQAVKPSLRPLLRIRPPL